MLKGRFNITGAFQLFQVLRYGALLGVSVLFSWWMEDVSVISLYEKLLLLGASVTFFWVPAFFDSFLVLARNDEEIKPGLYRFTFRSTFSGSILSGLIVFVAGWTLFFSSEEFPLLIPFSLFIFLDTASNLVAYHYIAEKKTFRLTSFAAFAQIGYLLILCLPVALNWGGTDWESLMWGIWGLAVLGFLKLTWAVIESRQFLFGKGFSKIDTRKFFRLAIPVGLSILLSRSAEYVDGYLVLNFFEDDFASFRYGSKELPFVLLLANAFSVVRSGDIAGAGSKELPGVLGSVRSGSKRLIIWLFGASLLLLVVSQPLYEWVFAGKFNEAHLIFDVYILMVIPRLVFPQTLFRGKLETSMLAWSAGVELLINIGLSLILMQSWGLQGIALASFIAFSCEKTFLAIMASRKYKIGFQEYTPVMIWAGASVLLFATWLLKVYTPEIFP